MHSPDRRSSLPFVLAVGAAFAVAVAIAFVGSLIASVVVGLLVLAVGLRLAWVAGPSVDEGRRRVLIGLTAAGMGAVAAGSAVGRVALRATRPNATPDLDEMARAVGAEGLKRVQRGYSSGRSGDLQLLLQPGNTSNYANESLALAPRDPRSSHAMAWGYLDRVPITVYAPGIVTSPEDRTDEVTLADLAPTTAKLMGFDFEPRDGAVLPAIPTPARPPKVIVTFVIDGGGWNVYSHPMHVDQWPVLRKLMRKSVVYRNAFMGSFPTVTAAAHATIGTGEYPRRHGIPGHNLRYQGRVAKAYGDEGQADPSYLTAPTLAEAWNEETGRRAWAGEIGYQIWHLGMIGSGGTPLGKPPVAIYFDEDRTKDWQPQNPELFRLPDGIPPRAVLSDYLGRYFPPEEAEKLDRGVGRNLCCSPPIIHFQGDVIAQAFENEPIGRGEVTSLLYINYKMPDYTGHVYNFISSQEQRAINHVDRELGRLVDILESRFEPGEFVLIVTADHGQCPLVDDVGGVRLDPIQLQKDIERAFGKSVFSLVEAVWPSEVYVDRTALWDAGIGIDEIAAFLRDYRYGDNVGLYIPDPAIDHDKVDREEFAAVFSTDYIAGITDGDVARAGAGNYADSDPGIPERLR